jgi:addiction module RelE/StbE family toxin
MKIVWTRAALEDLESIRLYIETDNPRAAVRVVLRILRLTTLLERTPQMGRPGRVIGTRELVVPKLPYIVAYRMHADVLEVLRVLHTSRRWPKRLGR